MTPEMEHELRPKQLAELLDEIARERIEGARRERAELPPDQRRRRLQTDWGRLLGDVQAPADLRARRIGDLSSIQDQELTVRAERLLLTVERDIVVPVLLLVPRDSSRNKTGKPSVVVAISQAGKSSLLKNRSAEIAALLKSGRAVCLPDVRGTGETSPGRGRGRRSAGTSLSSSELMLGGTILGAQLRDLRAVLAWLRSRDDLDARQPGLWGDSLVPPNPPDTDFRVPRDDDQALPAGPEPLGGLLALLAALYVDDVRAVYVHGGLAGFQSVVTRHLTLVPHDSVVPGALTVGDLADVTGALAPRLVRLEGLVDGWNRTPPAADLAAVYQPAISEYRAARAPSQISLGTERTSPARWLPSP